MKIFDVFESIILSRRKMQDITPLDATCEQDGEVL